MLSLARASAKQLTRPVTRSLAAFAHTQAAEAKAPNDAGPSKTIQAEDQKHYARLAKKRVPVDPNHGLYAFFRKRVDEDETVSYEVVESPEDAQLSTGRAWEAAELRNKSFKDLHTLWYVTLRERNLLATQKEEARRMGVANTDLQVPMIKVRACRKTMARIKLVLNERRLAHEGAVKLAEKQIYDKLLKKADLTPYNKQDLAVLAFQSRPADPPKKQPSMRRGPRKVEEPAPEAKQPGWSRRTVRVSGPNPSSRFAVDPPTTVF